MKNINSPNHTCSACHQKWRSLSDAAVSFCPFCGKNQVLTSAESDPLASYHLLRSIGKGGMGEVFLAYDETCNRHIALKQIRSDLVNHPQIKRRFLKEAHITCQLTHPSIIPIYTIQKTKEAAYYTMPFVEGKTLKEIIRQTYSQDRKGEKLNHIGGSIPALMRIFISICQAVAYAHSKGVIHRDLKPENIIVGKYGEVLILDWGLATYLSTSQEEESSLEEPKKIEGDITRTGKIVGTISYMAPERAMGKSATIQTDIYSLGVILYQLLTLRSPFKRGALQEFRKVMTQEVLIDPVVAAPYRDVPRVLAQLSEKCLLVNPKDRYMSVDQIIHELEIYLEGRSEWSPLVKLDPNKKEDWEFQENVLLANHMAVTRMAEEAEWVSLMISKESISENTKIETRVCLGEATHGVGFLLSIPEPTHRHYLNEGYCLWIGSDSHRFTKLLKSNVEVVHAPDIFLKRHQWYSIRIEKIEKSIHLYINNILQFSYIAHLPLIGTHVGILAKDDDFEIAPLQIFVGSLNITVNCLAVPDAFLAHGDYEQALSEYRRIAYSFPDRVEGREALFRAGLTFMEQAKTSKNRQELLDKALEEFQKLHQSPGAPLQYLGKALVYQALNDTEEEIKCFELAYRRYPQHPLLSYLQEHIIYRMHEMSRYERMSTYRFILLAIRLLPEKAFDTHTKKLLSSLQRHWEVLPFLEKADPTLEKNLSHQLAIPLAFWLKKPYILLEIIEEASLTGAICSVKNALFALSSIGDPHLCSEWFDRIPELNLKPETYDAYWFKGVIAPSTESLDKQFSTFFFHKIAEIEPLELRSLFFFMDKCLDASRTDLIHACTQLLSQSQLTFESKIKLSIRLIWSDLIEKNWNAAGEHLHSYSFDILNSDSTLLHFLYGCWLQATEGHDIAMIHFSGIFPKPYPHTWSLGTFYLLNQLPNKWDTLAFWWEKMQLYRQLILFYGCAKNETMKNYYQMIILKQENSENA